MIKEKSLSPLRTYRYPKNSGVQVEQVCNKLEQVFYDAGFNVCFESNMIKPDALFSSSFPCMVMKNAEHMNDYFYYVFYVNGDSLYVSVGGTSKQAKHDIFAKQVKVMDGGASRVLKEANQYRGIDKVVAGAAGLAGAAIGSSVRLVAKGVNSILRDKQAYERELEYYAQVLEILDHSI